jgi:hypothetical protein
MLLWHYKWLFEIFAIDIIDYFYLFGRSYSEKKVLLNQK